MPTNQSAVIVLEPQPRWAPLLRRDLGTFADRVRETRHSEQARSELLQRRASLLVVELGESRLEGQLSLLAWLLNADPAACVVCSGEAKYAKLAAEAGAVAHLRSLQQWESLVGIARRHLLLQQASANNHRDYDPRVDWRQKLTWFGYPATGVEPT